MFTSSRSTGVSILALIITATVIAAIIAGFVDASHARAWSVFGMMVLLLELAVTGVGFVIAMAHSGEPIRISAGPWLPLALIGGFGLLTPLQAGSAGMALVETLWSLAVRLASA